MKYQILILAFSVLFCLQLGAQSFFTIGTNYSVLSDDHAMPFGKEKLENFKLTPSVGYGYLFNIRDKWSYQPAISLGDLGGINVPDRPRTVLAIYAISLNQSINYQPLRWLSIGLSPTVNYNVNAGITGKGLACCRNGMQYFEEKLRNWKKISESAKLNRWVFSLVPSISFHIYEEWSVSLFYRTDLTPVGYPFKVLDHTLRGYGTGVILRYQLSHKKKPDTPLGANALKSPK